ACASAPGVGVAQLHRDRPMRGEHPAQLGGDSQQSVDELGRCRLVADLFVLVGVVCRQVGTESDEGRGRDHEIDRPILEGGESVEHVADDEPGGHAAASLMFPKIHSATGTATALPNCLYRWVSELPGTAVQWSGNPWSRSHSRGVSRRTVGRWFWTNAMAGVCPTWRASRSEERRVGKEGR